MIERLDVGRGLILPPERRLDWPSTKGGIDKKSFGEPTPRIADISRHPELIALFATSGMLERIRRKLAALSRKNGRLVPAKGSVALASPLEELVYVGVDFALNQKENEPVIAGVMAHEWGHLLSDEVFHQDLSGLTWDDIWEIRREEEAAADAFAGRALYLLNYALEPLTAFLKKSKGAIETHKYHPVELRAKIVKAAFETELRRKGLLEKLFGRSVYPNPSAQPLITLG